MKKPIDVRAFAALLVAALWLAIPMACKRGDDLEERIARLKADMTAAPTDANNYMERLVVLEQWWNDLCLRGRLRVPQIAAVPFYAIRMPHRFTDQAPELIRQAAAVFAFVEEHGDRNGRLVRIDNTDLVVDRYATVVLEYTVGSVEIATGGSLRIGQIFSANRAQKLQSADAVADAYVSFEVTSDATTETTAVPWRGVYNDLFNASPAPALRVTEGSLEAGDTVRITVGDRSGGGRGLRMISHDSDDYRFVLELDPTGDGVFMPADFVSVKILGAEPAGLRAVVPSVVDVGEPFVLRLAVEDRYFSPATFDGGSFSVRLGKDLVGEVEIPSGRGEGRLKDLVIHREGGYRYQVTSADGELTTFSNPVLVEAEPAQRIYWGELHGHSGLEDGVGTVHRYCEYARDVAFLDFASLTGHDVLLSAAGWEEIRRETEAANRPGFFVAYMGYEWTMLYPFGGHHNVFFKDDKGRYATWREAPELPELYEKLREIQAIDNVLVIPHAHEPGNWNVSDPELERLVEVYSMHGSFEYFGQRYLDRGFRLGLIAASDDHSGHPGNSPAMISNRGGLTAVYAPRLDRDAVWAGLRSRATYGTSGKRPVVVFTVDGSNPGGVLPVGSVPTLQARVLGTAPIDHIDVIKNGAVEFSRDYLWPQDGDAEAVQIMFHSPSETPGDEVIPPIQVVPWRGWIDVSGARIAAMVPLGIDNYTDVFEQADDRRIWFTFKSRGDFDGVLLKLADASPNTSVVVRVTSPLEPEGAGTGGSKGLQPVTGPPPVIAVHEVGFRVSELARNKARFDLGPNGVVLARRIRADGDWDVSFQFRPTEPPAQNDYYYLRVVQIDGEAVWTSPIWIGDD